MAAEGDITSREVLEEGERGEEYVVSTEGTAANEIKEKEEKKVGG